MAVVVTIWHFFFLFYLAVIIVKLRPLQNCLGGNRREAQVLQIQLGEEASRFGVSGTLPFFPQFLVACVVRIR